MSGPSLSRSPSRFNPAKSKMTLPATQVVYDVIVLGAQLAGTLAGALLAKRNHRVLHIDPEGLGTHYLDRSGYQLPYTPALLPSLKALPQAEAALTELGMAVDVHRAMDALESELQILFPRHRLDFPTRTETRAAELGREMPEHKERVLSAVNAICETGAATDAFFTASQPLPPEGFFERFALRKAAKAVPALDKGDECFKPLEGIPFGDALAGLAQFLGYLDGEEAGSLARLRPLSQVLRGAHRFSGGAQGLREAVRKRLAELRGDQVGDDGNPATIEELIFDGARITGVKLASSQNVYRAKYFIAGLDVAALAPLIPPKAKRRGLSDLFESVRPRQHLFTINIVVRAAGLPLGLKNLALMMHDDEELGPVLLEVLPARQADKDVPGEVVLCAGAFISSAERDAGEPRLRSLASRLEQRVLELAPFITPHVVASSVPLLDAPTLRGNRALPHPLLEPGDQPYLGITGLTHSTPCKNLFLASREVLPGLGVEGEFIAGVKAAGIVHELLKKHDPLK